MADSDQEQHGHGDYDLESQKWFCGYWMSLEEWLDIHDYAPPQQQNSSDAVEDNDLRGGSSSNNNNDGAIKSDEGSVGSTSLPPMRDHPHPQTPEYDNDDDANEENDEM